MLTSTLEIILFVAARQLTLKKLAEILEVSKDEIEKAVHTLSAMYEADTHGIRLLQNGGEVQMVTSAESAGIVQKFLKDETTGELSKPSLETLTIIAYRGPISKAELEQIRGVNCSIILRNLMMRGLVESDGEAGLPQTSYRVTTQFVRFLGMTQVSELPEYEALRSHEVVVGVLGEKV